VGFADANPVDDIDLEWFEVPEVVIAEGGAVSGLMPFPAMSGMDETLVGMGLGPL